MDQNSGRIDDRHDARGTQAFEARTYVRDDRVNFGNPATSRRSLGEGGRPERLQMPAHGMDDDRLRQAHVAERLEHLIYRRDRSKP
jgi:hypothetical protein